VVIVFVLRRSLQFTGFEIAEEGGEWTSSTQSLELTNHLSFPFLSIPCSLNLPSFQRRLKPPKDERVEAELTC